MTYRSRKQYPNDMAKLEALKALRGQHDQRKRCGVIEILYGTGGETDRFLEAEIARLENGSLWKPGDNEDGD
jgi:hypothetical protein